MPNMNKFAALSVLAESKSALKVSEKKTNVHSGPKEKKEKPAAAAPVAAKAAQKAAPAAAAAPKAATKAAPVDPNAAKDLKSLAAVLKAEREAKAIAAAKAAEAKAIADAAAAEKAAAEAEAAAKAAAEAPAPAEGEAVAEGAEATEAAAAEAAPAGPKIIEIVKPEKKTLTLAEIEEERKKNSVKVVLKARAVDASALKGLEVLKKDEDEIKIVVKKPTTPATAKPGAKPAAKKAAAAAPQPQVSEAREKGKALTLAEIQAMQAPRPARGGYRGGYGAPRPVAAANGFSSPNVDDKNAFPSL